MLSGYVCVAIEEVERILKELNELRGLLGRADVQFPLPVGTCALCGCTGAHASECPFSVLAAE